MGAVQIVSVEFRRVAVVHDAQLFGADGDKGPGLRELRFEGAGDAWHQRGISVALARVWAELIVVILELVKHRSLAEARDWYPRSFTSRIRKRRRMITVVAVDDTVEEVKKAKICIGHRSPSHIGHALSER